jgi:hypothetical protein
MLYREIIAVCSEIHIKHTNTAMWAERRIIRKLHLTKVTTGWKIKFHVGLSDSTNSLDSWDEEEMKGRSKQSRQNRPSQLLATGQTIRNSTAGT